MKQYISIVLGIACALLAISLFMLKRGDDAQHVNDVSAITDYSNQLDTAQIQVATANGTVIILSNSLVECRSASLTFSNRLLEAESTIALDLGHITNLNQQVTEMKTENQTLGQQAMDFTNQVAGLTKQLAETQASLAQTNQDLAQVDKEYGLLEERFRQNVAERVVAERKFYNTAALQAQLERLKENPFEMISSESIYAGLDVVVNSNGTFHVLSRD